MPDGRSTEYAIWRACERLGIRPPDMSDSWDEMSRPMQALVLAYNQVRTYEEAKQDAEGLEAQLKILAARR